MKDGFFFIGNKMIGPANAGPFGFFCWINLSFILQSFILNRLLLLLIQKSNSNNDRFFLKQS